MTLSTQERILHSAIELVAANGLAGVSMSAIAAEAGVSRQTLYNHFSDVESVIYAAAAAHQTESLHQLRAVMQTIASPSARLEHLVRHTAAVAAIGHPTLSSQGFSEETRGLLHKHDTDVQQLVAETLERGVDLAEFRPDLSIEIDALLILRLIEACGELVAAQPDTTERVVSIAVTSVLRAVGSTRDG